MKNYKEALWDFLTDGLGVWSFGRYYTCEGASGYNWFCSWIKNSLEKEGFNISIRNIKKIVKIIDNN